MCVPNGITEYRHSVRQKLRQCGQLDQELSTCVNCSRRGAGQSCNHSDWIGDIYEMRTNRFVAENEKIWITGRIFVPAAFLSVGVLKIGRETDLSQLLIVTVLSIALVVYWHLIAVAHRRFQIFHLVWLEEIELIRGTYVDMPKARWSLEEARKCFLWLFVGGWIFVWLCILLSRN